MKANKITHTVRSADYGTKKVAGLTRGMAIKLMCTECMGFDSPSDCTSPMCPLFPFRGMTRKSKIGD